MAVSRIAAAVAELLVIGCQCQWSRQMEKWQRYRGHKPKSEL